MGLKPVVKSNSSRQRVAEWITSKLPENHKEMSYVEPFLGDGSILLNKEPSFEEIVSDSDAALINVWRAIRDEDSAFCSRIKRMKHSKSTFERNLKASGGDYMDDAVREFILRQMSRGAEKKSYLPQPSEIRCGDCWCGLFDRIADVAARIKPVFMLNRDGLSVIKAFDQEKSLVFCDPPDMDAENSSYHAELGDVLKNFRGKVMICARNSAMYRRIYGEWNRKGLPGSKNESLWMNF